MYNKKIILITFIFLLVFPQKVSWGLQKVNHWKHYVAGVSYYDKNNFPQAIHELELAVKQTGRADYLHKLAESYKANKQYEKASQTYYKEAQAYLKKGLMDDYLATEAKGDALATNIQVFKEEEKNTSKKTNLAKYEPSSGLYLGAFVEYDSNVGPRNVKAFNQIARKNHAVYYTYHEYGNPFPVNWVAQVKDAGAAVHLAFEPNKGLDIVQDNEYLHKFAQDAKASEVPIFLRFASEMNGDWAPWNGNPQKYIEKFRLVADVMAKEAPNVAMVWAPNSVPQKEINKYYPGDQWVDWVGVNLYSVSYFNGNRKQPASQVNPLDLLDFIYKNYASRKPIQVSEYAATHYTATDGLDSTKFAINKMNMLYQGVRMLYPRVKEINWYSVNNLERATRNDRRLNNFSLTENPKVLSAYHQMISSTYFLSKVVNGPYTEDESESKIIISKLEGAKVDSSINGMSWVKTYDPYISKVTYKLNGKILTSQEQYPFSFNIVYSDLKLGENKLEIIVFDSKGGEAARKSVSFTRGNLINGNAATNTSLISKKPDLSRIKEVGWAKMAGRKFLNSIVVTKEDKYYFSVSMISKSYPDVKAFIDLNTMEHLTYKNSNYISYGEMVNLFKENNTYDDYITYTSKPMNKEKNKVGPEWLKEPGFVEMNGKGYRAGLVVTKDDKFYFNVNMITESYPDVKAFIDLNTMEHLTYKNSDYISYGEMSNLFKENNTYDNYTTHSSKPMNKAINKVGPEWLKEPGLVEMNGKRYRAGLVVANDNKIYLNSEMVFENYLQLKNSSEIESMDTKIYKNIKYLNRRELEKYFNGNGIKFGYTMHDSFGPPKD